MNRGHCAPLTGAGPAAIAVVRACGRGVEAFLRDCLRLDPAALRAGDVRLATLRDAHGRTLDRGVLTVLAAAPRWQIDLHLHGGPWVREQCLRRLEAFGLRRRAGMPAFAAPGAPLWQEAWAQLPRMETLDGARWLLAQPPRLARALRRVLRSSELPAARRACARLARRYRVFLRYARPTHIALLGPPNAGKSTLANALAGAPVSLVSPLAGTTRDWVEFAGQIAGLPVRWRDTAGLDVPRDALEQAAREQTRRCLRGCALRVVVLDATPAAAAARRRFVRHHGRLAAAVVALNKLDAAGADDAARRARLVRAVAQELPPAWRDRVVGICALHGTGLERLTARLAAWLDAPGERSAAAPYTLRQVRRLRRAARQTRLAALRRELRACLGPGGPERPLRRGPRGRYSQGSPGRDEAVAGRPRPVAPGRSGVWTAP